MLNNATNKNGFKMHDIDHVSVSQANKFRESPSAWYAQYLLGHKFPIGSAAFQGIAVENGISVGLFNQDYPEDKCVAIAHQYFESAVIKNYSAVEKLPQAEILEKHLPIITKMVKVGLEQLRPLGIPDRPPEGMAQFEIKVPVKLENKDTINNKGYLDFVYQDKKLIIDLKTSARAPSGWSLSHGIQAAVYKKAANIMSKGEEFQVKFLYVLTRQKDPYVWLEMDDPDYYIKTFKNTVNTMNKVLSFSNNKKDIRDIIVHNPDSFYWNGAQEIEQKIYG